MFGVTELLDHVERDACRQVSADSTLIPPVMSSTIRVPFLILGYELNGDLVEMKFRTWDYREPTESLSSLEETVAESLFRARPLDDVEAQFFVVRIIRKRRDSSMSHSVHCLILHAASR